jgi:uncharacterized protein (DUF305 family)
MTVVELEHEVDPKLKEMARKVIEGQTREIKELDMWLERHPPRQVPR